MKISPTKTVIFHPSESRHLSSPSVSVATDRWFLPEDFVVFDLETTGFSPKTAEIIEIGAIRISRDFSRRESFQTILKIEGSLPRKITQITGITRKMINSEGRDPKEAVQKFADFIGDLPLVAYNVSFDQSFILPAAAACGIKLRNDFDCALKKARLAWPDRTSYKLVDIARDAQLSDEGTHRALGDARRALIVYAAAMTILHSADRPK
jgi:DNA polymerase III epsilon subunit-like protein